MKLLENSQFEALSNALSTENVFSKITTRFESYSCKMAGDCKRLYKQMHDEHRTGTSPPAFQMLGPSFTILSSTSSSSSSSVKQLSTSTPPNLNQFNTYMHSRSLVETINNDSLQTNYDQSSMIVGSLNNAIDIISKKTLFYLISTLNASFQPDYDFSNTLSSEFSKEPTIEFVIKNVENFLATVDVYSKLKQQIWDAIDKEINLNESEFYSYNPDLASDPCAEDGCLWFFNLFFYNKKMKRIVFFSCRCTSKSIDTNLDDADEELNDDLILDDNSYEETSMFYSLNKAAAAANVHNKGVGGGGVSTMIGYLSYTFLEIFLFLNYFYFYT